jgi:hypothetical protein
VRLARPGQSVDLTCAASFDQRWTRGPPIAARSGCGCSTTCSGHDPRRPGSVLSGILDGAGAAAGQAVQPRAHDVEWQREDDGVLLSVGSAKSSETSLLAVIDAKTLALLASAEVPSSIPLGFHGSFLRQAAPA